MRKTTVDVNAAALVYHSPGLSPGRIRAPAWTAILDNKTNNKTTPIKQYMGIYTKATNAAWIFNYKDIEDIMQRKCTR